MIVALPLCTVVVPTYERPEALARCLAALARLGYPHERREVIVVDDGGRRPLEPIVAPWRRALTLTLLRQVNAGPAAARNLALERAKGELVAFTDDDCEPASDWLRELVRAWQRTPAALVGGRTVNALPRNAYAATSQLIVDTAYDFFRERRSDLRFFASNNLAAPAARLREAGGFDAAFRYAEDRELCDRWLRAGEPLVDAPGAVVAHRRELDGLAFWRQHYGYGRGARDYFRARAACGGSALRPDPHFYLEVARRAVRAGPARGVAASLARLALWQAANLAGYLREVLVPAGTTVARPAAVPALAVRDVDDAA
jgi:GT2 family glycosyltransferase